MLNYLFKFSYGLFLCRLFVVKSASAAFLQFQRGFSVSI